MKLENPPIKEDFPPDERQEIAEKYLVV